MNTRFVLAFGLALAACREASSDDARPVAVVVPAPPCDKCTLDAPTEATRPLPLLVVLHGNFEDAEAAAVRWKDVAVERGFVVLSLHCPRNAGCVDGKWYRWPDTARWIKQQVNEVIHGMPIDPTRVFAAIDWLEAHARKPSVT